MNEPQVEYTPKQVIAGKLLTALEEGGVAVVLNEADLDLLIGGLASIALSERVHQFRDDLLRLRKEAFGR